MEGLHFDELSKIRALDPEALATTTTITTTTKDFIASEYTASASASSSSSRRCEPVSKRGGRSDHHPRSVRQASGQREAKGQAYCALTDHTL